MLWHAHSFLWAFFLLGLLSPCFENRQCTCGIFKNSLLTAVFLNHEIQWPMYIFLKDVSMKSLRKIAGASRRSDSNLGDIKHKFKFHPDCIGLNFTELSDICQRFNAQQRNMMSAVYHVEVCFPEVPGLRSLFGLCCYCKTTQILCWW